LKYSTSDTRSRRVAQAGFPDLHARGQVYRQVAPTQWCPECQTSIAQADIEDRSDVASVFATIPFRLADGGDLLIVEQRSPGLHTDEPAVAFICRVDHDRHARGQKLRARGGDQYLELVSFDCTHMMIPRGKVRALRSTWHSCPF
jgi:valyl-tRNA synthetase